ncbi:unnamed protein product [Diplocarpon coronariae]
MKFAKRAAFAMTIASLLKALPATVVERQLALVNSETLRQNIQTASLVDKLRQLQEMADQTRSRSRFIGTAAHAETLSYIYSQLNHTGYYNIDTQRFTASYDHAELMVNRVSYKSLAFTFSPLANVSTSLVAAERQGCAPEDYPAEVEGNVVIISPGSCSYDAKATAAGQAGAFGAVIYNSIEGEVVLEGQFEAPGNFIPTVGVSWETGQALLQSLGDVILFIAPRDVVTYNIIAETRGGDHDNVLMLGAHTDSVAAGPGINDNGSGTIGVLEVALQLSRSSTTNAVRFAFWSANEIGAHGSRHYISTLSQAEARKIRLYLDFDTIASPNYVYEVLDGDGSAFGMPGARGSGAVKRLWQDYFEGLQIETTPARLNGTGDFEPFLSAGIAVGGLSSGADGLKSQKDCENHGGQAGAPYDPNYHTARDRLVNINTQVFLEITKAIAHAVATLARSFETL